MGFSVFLCFFLAFLELFLGVSRDFSAGFSWISPLVCCFASLGVGF